MKADNNNLPKGWRKVRLGEIIEKIIDNRGKTPPLSKSGYPLIEVFALSRDRKYPIISDDKKQKFVSKDIYNEWFRSGHPKEGDILVSTVGTIAQWNLVPPDSTYCIAQNIVALRPDRNKTTPEFLFSYFRQHKFIKQVEGIVIGATQPSIKLPHFLNLEIDLPPLAEQKRIADILSAFDDKIELNNKIIKTLEQMAQEIFKEWFVKFRFPGWEKVKFVDSELGKIPEGWGVIDLYDYISFEGGSQPPKSMHIYEKREGYVRFIQNRDYESDAYITYIPESNRNKLCNEYDIMMDKYGEAGKVRFGLAGAYNVALAKITPKPPLMREYLRWFLKQPEIEKMIEGSAMASTRASVNKIVFKNLKILLPSRDLMEKFEEISKLYIDNYLKLRAENQTLAALRDLLLPKLMSGEIRV